MQNIVFREKETEVMYCKKLKTCLSLRFSVSLRNLAYVP